MHKRKIPVIVLAWFYRVAYSLFVLNLESYRVKTINVLTDPNTMSEFIKNLIKKIRATDVDFMQIVLNK